MKPILFNQEMVRAILDGRKSVTRRVIKFPEGQTGRLPSDGSRDHLFYPGGIKYPPYQTGSAMYVRETWCQTPNGMYWYKADNICLGCTEDGLCISEKDPYYKKVPYHKTCDLCEYLDGHENIKWRPSIHMPKEAARLFLRVKKVWAEKLQEITEEQAYAEGCESLSRSARYNFGILWDSTIKKSDLPRYGWIASPWVWVISFERISKEEAPKGES